MKASLLILAGLASAASASASTPSSSFTPSSDAVALFPTSPSPSRKLEYVLDCTDLVSDKAPAVELDEFGQPIVAEPSISQGGAAVDFMTGLRNDSGSWYADVLKNFMIYYCEMDDAKLAESQARCVPADKAFKGPGGGCIYPLDTPCDGVVECESSSNCYWKEPETGVNRERRYTDEEAEANAAFLGTDVGGLDQDSYSFTVVKYLILGLVLALLNVLIWTVFIVGRCCCCCLYDTFCCRCCSNKPKEEGYSTCFQVRVPIFFYFVFIAGIAASAGMTFVGNEDITTAIADAFKHAREGLNETQGFLDGAERPMVAIEGLVDEAADDTLLILAGTDYVEDGMDDITKSLSDFADNYADDLPDEAAGELTASKDQLQEQVGPIKEQIRGSLDTLETTLVDGREALKKAMGGAADQLDALNEKINNFYVKIDDTEASIDDTKQMRQAGVLVIFAAALFCVFFGLIGVASYWTPCSWDDFLIHLMNITWFFGSGLVTLTWIIAGVTMVLCVVWSDVCQFMDLITEDFEPYAGGKASVAANACFNNTPLVDAFNLTSKVDFQEKVDTMIESLDAVDFDESFGAVKDPVYLIADQIKSISVEPLGVLVNDITNLKNSEFWKTELGDELFELVSDHCQYADEFVWADMMADGSNSEEMMFEPWAINVKTGKTGNTAWETMALNTQQPYARQGAEDATAYMKRLYNAAGICTGGSAYAADPINETPLNCVRGDPSNPTATTPPSVPGAPFNYCNGGDGCELLCGQFYDALFEGDTASDVPPAWDKILEVTNVKKDMLADLGTECPDGQTCSPSQKAIDDGNTLTVVAYIDLYQENLEQTFGDLKDTTNNAVGDIMEQVRVFLCNMNCGFVSEVWDNVHSDVCKTMLGGLLQMSLSLWLLAIFMFLNAFVGAILVVRMRGVSTDEANKDDERDGVEMKGVTLNLYE